MSLANDITLLASLGIYLWYKKDFDDLRDEMGIVRTLNEDILDKGRTWIEDPLFFFRKN